MAAPNNKYQQQIVDSNGAIVGSASNPLVTTPGTGATIGTTPLTTVKSGELAGSASALQLPNVACSLVRFKASAANTGYVYLGASGVTKVDGTTDTTTGFQLAAGDDTGWLPVANLNQFYRICDNTTDNLTYLALV